MASAIVPSLRLSPSLSDATSPSSPSSSGDVIKPLFFFFFIIGSNSETILGFRGNSGDYRKLEVTLDEYDVTAAVGFEMQPVWLIQSTGVALTLRPRLVLD